jgi:hypothetical protein
VVVAVQLFVPGLYFRRCSKPPCYRIHPRRSSRSTPTLPYDDLDIGRIGDAGGCPTIGAGIVSAAGVQIVWIRISAPDDRFAVGPHCCGGESGVGAFVVLVAVQLFVFDCICRRCCRRPATPNYHFGATHTAVCALGLGASTTLVATHVSAMDCIFLPCSKGGTIRQRRPKRSFRCQSTPQYAPGRWDVDTLTIQLSVSYCTAAGVQHVPINPPQTIISVPVQTAI